MILVPLETQSMWASRDLFVRVRRRLALKPLEFFAHYHTNLPLDSVAIFHDQLKYISDEATLWAAAVAQ